MTDILMNEQPVDVTERAGIPFDAAAHAASMVGHHYRVDDFYEVGREKVREYARAVLDSHPAHHDEEAAKGLGYDGLIAPLTFVSIIGIIAQRKLFEEIVTGYDLSQIMQTDQRLVFHRPIQVAIGCSATCTSTNSVRWPAATSSPPRTSSRISTTILF